MEILFASWFRPKLCAKERISSMDISTSYLGLSLKNPLVVSASPLSQRVDTIKRLEDAGASALVLYSLFDEEIQYSQEQYLHFIESNEGIHAEAISYLPISRQLRFGADHYAEHLYQVKKSVSIPIIGSLNGAKPGKWLEYARIIEEAGASAIELNLYSIPTRLDISGEEIENNYLTVLREIQLHTSLPIAVKISPFFSNLSYFANRLAQQKAKGLVLFNRFYEPDIDIHALELESKPSLSDNKEYKLPMAWIGILHGRVSLDFAASTGIHNVHDVIKMIMVGANVTMLCSTLLKNGISHLSKIQEQLIQWLTEHEYHSLSQMSGSMSYLKSANPKEFERVHYLNALKSYPTEVIF